MAILVDNLPSTVTDAQLDNLKASFSSFGKIKKFEVSRSIQVILIELESGEDAAIKALNGTLVEAKPIEVKEIEKRNSAPTGPSPIKLPPIQPPQPPINPHFSSEFIISKRRSLI